LEAWDRPNFQVALDAWLVDREVEVVGLAVMEGYRAGLAELVRGGHWASSVELGGVEHVTVPLGETESVSCVQSGLWLVRRGEERVVVMLKSMDFGGGERLGLEVMAPERATAERVHAELRSLMGEHNVYRGRVLELRSRHFHDDEGAPLTVRSLPDVTRERSCCRPACSNASNDMRLASPATPSACARPGDTCVGGCCCMGRRASERR